MFFLVAKSCLALDANTKALGRNNPPPPRQVFLNCSVGILMRLTQRSAAGMLPGILFAAAGVVTFAAFTKALRGLDPVSTGAFAATGM